MVVKSNSRSNKWYVTTKSASTKSENFIHFASIHRYVGILVYVHTAVNIPNIKKNVSSVTKQECLFLNK